MSPLTFLVTGANRGIGLEWATQLLASYPDCKVIATARKLASAAGTADELAKLEHKYDGRLLRVQMDVSNLASIAEAVEACKQGAFVNKGIDVLICNAGILEGSFGGPFQPGVLLQLAENLKTNVVGTAAVVDAFLPLLRQGQTKQIWFASSGLASFGGPLSQTEVGAPGAVSKAAVNMWAVKLARALAPERFTVLLLNPGWVKTEMGGPDAEITAAESVRGMLKAAAGKGPADSGKFLDWEGKEVPW